MNVLVYSGPNVLPASVNWIRSTLKNILAPNYAVQNISAQSLATQPWAASCALLVLPTSSRPETTSLISQYVKSGGRLLAIGASLQRRGSILYLGPPGSIRLSDYILTFDSLQPDSLRVLSVDVLSRDGVPRQSLDGLLVANSGIIDGAENQEVMARLSGGDSGAAIAVDLEVENGKAAIWSLSLDQASDEERRSDEQKLSILRATLIGLGLRLPQHHPDATSAVHHPLPQLLMCAPWKPHIVHSVFEALKIRHEGDSAPVILKDSNDTFHFWPSTERDRLLDLGRTGGLYQFPDPDTWQPKHIVIEPHGSIPPSSATPLFGCTDFFRCLKEYRSKFTVPEPVDEWGHGEALIYGEVVTSTQTMIDRNPAMLNSLPSPLLSIASHQLVGRGRGSNTWLSPAGCLQFSLLLRVSLSRLPPQKLVFVQYLFGLAIVEACREMSSANGQAWGEKIRLKWPNDIYAVVGPRDQDRKKLGGILINTCLTGDKVEIVIGSGTNILNSPPIMSLAQLLPPDAVISEHLTMERSLAVILAKFEAMWCQFVNDRGSFDSFIDLYLDRWLHS
ncbi:class II aaRS and biotin synthetase [Punctularia strigosozonata HHB-11173 SS5]|uniref:class II aaRS and biotin synthetase n=1 Tax=Punctularia strigosozonata (strain HHB-11173) TaxID=741275 RepID=UPI0004416C61|nr:class II aaRS and biotin synthetase [Punctularia strigosozonata HHB-11173 SS5]EIN14514.1 class II aaRS and biotin synthetase [Punctularia strigosozonata HHB-11173 SS5]